MFSGFGDESFGDPTLLDDQSASAIIENGNPGRRTRRKYAARKVKGRVTNPGDKRLKANREANA